MQNAFMLSDQFRNFNLKINLRKSMRVLRNITCIFVICATVINCGSNKQVSNETPVTIKNPYFVPSSSGVFQSGFTIYLPVKEVGAITLDHIYFKNKKITLHYDQDTAMYIGKHKTTTKPDITMSGDPKKEYGNQPPTVIEKTPFPLKNNEAAVAYTKDGSQSYFKLDSIIEKKE